MIEPTFETLMQQHEMGQAYIAITKQMGPSAQLIAFLNYDRPDQGNFGLESFDIMSQHATILEEIGNDPSLSMAMESLGGHIKSALAKIKNVITSNKHSADLEKFSKGKLTPRDSKIYVESHDDFIKAVEAHEKVLPLLTWILSRLPKSHDVKAWEAFAKKNVTLGGKSDFDRKIEEIKNLNNEFSKYLSTKSVDFDKSGWNESNFKSGILTYVKETKNSLGDYEMAENVYEDLYRLSHDIGSLGASSSTTEEELDEKDENGKRKVSHKETTHYSNREDVALALKGINKAKSALSAAIEICFNTEVVMEKALKHVSEHFEV